MYEAKVTQLKRETDNSTMIIGDLNYPLSITARTSRQKINKEIEDLNYILSQLKLIYTPPNDTRIYILL